MNALCCVKVALGSPRDLMGGGRKSCFFCWGWCLPWNHLSVCGAMLWVLEHPVKGQDPLRACQRRV